MCFQFNQTDPSETEKRQALIQRLLSLKSDLPKSSDDTDPLEKDPSTNAWIESPFHVDYGIHLQVGENFYANHGCTILDCHDVVIGKNVLLAPHVCISAATHPVDPDQRRQGLEYSAPITIGDNVWVGANATICPGVTLGDNVVVGAGAVVTKSFPDNVVIAGVPAKVIQKVNPKPSAPH